jgi:hypothetical protein
MKRIDTINARENMFGVGKSGFHDNADLPGQDATYVSPEWFNTIQEELCNLLELSGISLNPSSKRQLYDLLSSQKIIEEDFIHKNQIVDNLTTNDSEKVASAKQVKILNDKAFGVSQSSKSVTLISGTTYTNTKNKPITIAVATNGSSSNAASITINGIQLFSTNSSGWHCCGFTVGVGESYKVTGGGISAIEFS